jgi:hypothetical protein
MNMTVIDKRGTPLTVTFGDLKVGDIFQSNTDRVCIKVSSLYAIVLYNTCEYYEAEWQNERFDCNELIIPLKATLTIERGE